MLKNKAAIAGRFMEALVFMKNRFVVISILLVLTLVCTSCSSKKADYVDDGTASFDLDNTSESSADQNRVYGDFVYPDNPVAALRDYLNEDIAKRDLPMELGGIQRITGGWQDAFEFMITFTNHDNACIVSFATKSEGARDDYYSLDGKDNPSFTLAFKDSDNAQDMITILTTVIMYLSPEVGLQDAERMAVRQDQTISIDGCSTPLDIGGYQVQAHYTNPHVYFTTEAFSSNYGVSIRALKQIWDGEIDLSQCEKLSSMSDFQVLDNPQMLLTDEFQIDSSSSRIVYADFTIVDCWEYQEPIHGDLTTYVVAKSPHGKEYTLVLDPMRAPYAFGIGINYTLVVCYYQGEALITYAIQHAEGE